MGSRRRFLCGLLTACSDRTQANVRNRLVHVGGSHPGTPDAAIGPALEWLKQL